MAASASSSSNNQSQPASPSEVDDLTTTEQLRLPRSLQRWTMTESFLAVRAEVEKVRARLRALKKSKPKATTSIETAFAVMYKREQRKLKEEDLARSRRVERVNAQRNPERLRIYNSDGNLRWRRDHSALLSSAGEKNDWHTQQVSHIGEVGELFGPAYIEAPWSKEDTDSQTKLASAVIRLKGRMFRAPPEPAADRLFHHDYEAWGMNKEGHLAHIGGADLAYFAAVVRGKGGIRWPNGCAPITCSELGPFDMAGTENYLRGDVDVDTAVYEVCYSPTLEYSGYVLDHLNVRHFFYSESGFTAVPTDIPTERNNTHPLHALRYMGIGVDHRAPGSTCQCSSPSDFSEIPRALSTYMGFMWAMPETVAWWDLLYPVLCDVLEGNSFAKAMTCFVIGYTSKHNLEALAVTCMNLVKEPIGSITRTYYSDMAASALEPFPKAMQAIYTGKYVSEKVLKYTLLAGKHKALEIVNDDADRSIKRQRLESVVVASPPTTQTQPTPVPPSETV